MGCSRRCPLPNVDRRRERDVRGCQGRLLGAGGVADGVGPASTSSAARAAIVSPPSGRESLRDEPYFLPRARRSCRCAGQEHRPRSSAERPDHLKLGSSSNNDGSRDSDVRVLFVIAALPDRRRSTRSRRAGRRSPQRACGSSDRSASSSDADLDLERFTWCGPDESSSRRPGRRVELFSCESASAPQRRAARPYRRARATRPVSGRGSAPVVGQLHRRRSRIRTMHVASRPWSSWRAQRASSSGGSRRFRAWRGATSWTTATSRPRASSPAMSGTAASTTSTGTSP